MTLREKVERLLTDAPLPHDERKMLQLVLDTTGEGELDGLLYEDVEAHVVGRFEWYFFPNGTLRRRP